MAKKRGIAGIHSAKAGTTTWLTPPDLPNILGPFDLDPCAAPDPKPWPTAQEHYTWPRQDGLLLPWHGRVWLNPPYGKELAVWLRKLAQHGRGTSLIFARTDTDAFMSYVFREADAVMFVHGRLHFHYPDGTRAKQNSGGPSVLVAYGAEDAEKLLEAELSGAIPGKVLPVNPRVMIHMALHVNPPVPTWRELVISTIKELGGQAGLQELYRALEAHPKAKANPNYRAKIRQTTARANLDRVDDGVYAIAM